jgi:type IV secretory pathway VirB2 component (pilin)
MVVIVEKNQQNTMQGDNVAKVIASVIIAGIMLMFGYGLLHWIFFE